ncbi:bacteriocin [Actinorhabdospora filicis]|uniref:Type 1 encapsulin shell protein n=1 Tax=Actinorhabdospora filicis TaxID=1785913 RepID=A0A9W6W5D5_9ACTN|nr:family 1 encapsulin nanocompartment shell protein [Actinorhabdospora filicis]GLZ80257.1 bacteriocin [Actinorhabdospora filicis]
MSGDNLHRNLAPISAAAWADLEAEAKRTFERHLAGRRVVDVSGPGGLELAAVGTGHTRGIDPPAEGVRARAREALHLVELRVPFTVSREAVDDVARGSRDSDWQPVKDAARKLAFIEDGLICGGYAAAGITGLRDGASNPAIPLPQDARDYPEAVSKAATTLRLAGVNGPYSLLLSAEAYTAVSETSDEGYPIREHLSRVVDGEIIWAPAIEGGYLLSTRGGDFELHLGQDVSIGYASHDAESVELYFEETVTFAVYTGEAIVALT